MKRKLFNKNIYLLALSAIFALVSIGCKEMSNEADGSKTLTIDLANIKEQLEPVGPAPSLLGASSGSITSSTVKSLVLGAIVVTSRSDPYLSTTKVTEKIEEDLKQEAINSVNYLSVVDLPINEDYIEFLVPPQTAGKWQVAVVSFDFNLDVLADWEDYESKGKILHKGFTEGFYTFDTIGEQIIQIDMENYDKEDNTL